MDSIENSEEILPVEGAMEIDVTGSPESLDRHDSQEEIMDLIFPEDRLIPVKIYAYVSRVSGKPMIKIITDRPTPDFVKAGLTEYEIRSSWTIPTASQMDTYREECSEYNQQAQSMLSNNLMIRDTIVINHLKELLVPPSYKPFPLKYSRPNRLSGETVRQLKLMHSGIYDKLYVEFVSESCVVV